MKTTLKTSGVPSKFCKSMTMLIVQVAWAPPPGHLHEMQHVSVSCKHLHNLSAYSLQSTIEVSIEAVHAILYLIMHWQYPCSISYHTLAVSTKAWLFYVLSCLVYVLSCLGSRQWPEVSDFVARFCTLRKSENTRTCKNCTRNAWRCVHNENKLYLGLYNHCGSCVCPSVKCFAGHTTEWLE